MTRRIAGAMAAVVVAAALLLAQDAPVGSVKITAARANVRAEAKDTGAVLGQAPLGTILTLLDVEGDWYHVEVMVGGTRVRAYISKKVATVVTPIPSPAPAAAAAPPPPPNPVRDGLSVALQTKGAVGWIFAESAALHAIPTGAKIDTLRAGVDLLKADASDPPAEGATPVVFLWTLPGASAARALDDRRPTLVATYKEVPGYSPESLVPALVRLAPTPAGTRLVALVRGRADQSSRADADWDVVKDLKQDIVKTDIVTPEPGGAQITPLADLTPGEYAIVFRPTPKKKLSGASVLRRGTEMKLFTDVWAFEIK